MRRLVIGALAAVCLGLASLGLFVAGAAAATRPSFVVIQTDDQPLNEFNRSFRDLDDRWQPIMPNTMKLIRGKGVDFSHYMTPFPLCAPSRASLLSGRYAQNHGVIRIGGPQGSWPAFQSGQIENENMAVWLQRAGYDTLHFGKFMNNYGGKDDPPETVVPPGWNRWVSDATDNSTRDFYGYRQNIDGQITPPLGWRYYGPEAGGGDPYGCPDLGLTICNYHTDSMSVQAADAIKAAGTSPFYLQVDYHTPHGDSRPPIGPEPAPRHYDTALRTPGPRPAGFNERNMRDKPSFLRGAGAPPLTTADVNAIDTEYRKSVEALRSVDEGVGRIIAALRDSGRLEDTYVIFTSDNGYFNGQHRIARGKLLPYQPALQVPFVMRGPGIKPHTVSGEPMANQDIAPTILGLAGVQAGLPMDGRSMEPFWKKPTKRSRRPILLSSYQQANQGNPGDYPGEPVIVTSGAHTSVKSPNQNYVGIRLGPYKYVEYFSGDKELYDLKSDPAELDNRAGAPRYRKVQNYMDRQLKALRGCSASSCRTQAPPWPKPPRR